MGKRPFGDELNVRTIVGIDFDNTLANYDAVMHEIAVEQGLLNSSVARSKGEVRDHVRRLPDGEVQWQKLQGAVYGPRMKEARSNEGALSFIQGCRQRGFSVYVVSHKTRFAKYDGSKTNLRTAALTWLEEQQFLTPEGAGIPQDDVFFEETRLDKIKRIRSLGCTHFIDDLEETFLEAAFPRKVKKILYAPGSAQPSIQGVMVARNWEEIGNYFFDGRS